MPKDGRFWGPFAVSRREEMLERIRKALGQPGQPPMSAPEAHNAPPLINPMPSIGREEIVPKFEAEWGKVGGLAHRVSSLEDLERVIGSIMDAAEATSIVLSRNPLLVELGLAERLRAQGKSVAIWPSLALGAPEDEGTRFREASFSAAVGITGLDFALAETGSLVVSSRTEGSQLGSLAPPIHIALYRRSQAVGSLDEVLDRLPLSSQRKAPTPGRSVVFITGPSRTADIEQILVRGVHGPREVHAILVEESCFG